MFKDEVGVGIADLKTDIFSRLQRMKMRKLWLLSVIFSVLLTEAVVAVMGLSLIGEVTSGYLLTGLVAAGIAASLVVVMLSCFLEKQRESEGRFRELIEHAPEAIVVFDVEQNRLVDVNANAEKLFGYSREELLKKSLLDFYPPGQPDAQLSACSFREHNERCLQGESLVFKRRVRSAKGREVICEVRLVRLPAGDRQLLRGSFVDITECERNDKQLWLKDFALNHVNEAAYLINRQNMQFIYVNDEACRALGYSREELLAMTVFDIDPDPNPQDSSMLARQNYVDGSVVFERRHKTKSGVIFPVEIQSTSFHYEGAVISLALVRNISARKRQASMEETRLHIFERLAQGGGLPEILDLVARYVEQGNPDFLASVMLVDGEGKHLLLAASPSLPHDYREELGSIAIGEGRGACGTAAWRGETVIAEDLRTHPYWTFYNRLALQAGLLSCWSEPIFDSSGKVLGTFGIYRREPGGPSACDLELIRRSSHLAAIAIERRRMEDALLTNEQEFRSLAENLPDCIMRYDLDCRCIYVNPSCAHEMGMPPTGAINAMPDEPWCGNISLDEYKLLLRHVMETGNPANLVLSWGRLTDGTIANHALRIVAERAADEKVKGCLAIGRNITAQMETERHLEESRTQLRGLVAKNEAIREEERKYIAREVHDELGQILTGLQMDISMLGNCFGPVLPALQEHLHDTTLDMVNKSLAIARNVASSLRPAALDMGVVPAIDWLAGRFSKNTGLDCEVHVHDEDRDICLDENTSIALFRITQESLTNIARHANASKVDITICQKRDECLLEVRDNGSGFDSAIIKKSTFGLVGIRERAFMLGGKFFISSTPGTGTVISVRIPAHNDSDKKC